MKNGSFFSPGRELHVFEQTSSLVRYSHSRTRSPAHSPHLISVRSTSCECHTPIPAPLLRIHVASTINHFPWEYSDLHRSPPSGVGDDGDGVCRPERDVVVCAEIEPGRGLAARADRACPRGSARHRGAKPPTSNPSACGTPKLSTAHPGVGLGTAHGPGHPLLRPPSHSALCRSTLAPRGNSGPRDRLDCRGRGAHGQEEDGCWH